MSSVQLKFALFALTLTPYLMVGCEAPSPDPSNGGSDPYDGLECRFNSDCELGFRCEEGACVEQEAEEVCEGEGCPCERDSECSARFVCDSELRKL